jgi:hypothetical protein
MAKEKAMQLPEQPAPSWRNPGDADAAYSLGVQVMGKLREMGGTIPTSFWAGIFAEMECHDEPVLRRIGKLALDVMDEEDPVVP